MRTYVVAFLMALVACAVLTPLVRWLALRFELIPTPVGRDVHRSAIPRLGGVALALSTLTPVVTLFVVESGVASFVRLEAERAWVLLFCGFAICGLGLVDDLRRLRATHKLVIQLLIASIAFNHGYRIDGVFVPYVGAISTGLLAYPLTMLWIVGVTNAVNLIDGLDGLAAGVVFCAAATNLIVALVGGSDLGVLTALLMASLMGALVGFLFYNWNPARIFMGDSGSYFLGFVLACSSLLAPMQKMSTTVALLVPMVALGIPIFDTLISITRRLYQRKSVFGADQGHIHHRLLDRGITHRRAVLGLYAVSVVLATSATVIALGRDWSVGAALLGASVTLFALFRFASNVPWADGIRNSRRAHQAEVFAELRRVVPELLARLHDARTLRELLAALEWLVGRGPVCWVELATPSGHHRIGAPTSHASSRASQASARFPLSDEGTFLEFRSSSEVAWSEQSQLLLQLISDVIARRLPEVETEDTPRSSPNRELAKRTSFR